MADDNINKIIVEAVLQANNQQRLQSSVNGMLSSIKVEDVPVNFIANKKSVNSIQQALNGAKLDTSKFEIKKLVSQDEVTKLKLLNDETKETINLQARLDSSNNSVNVSGVKLSKSFVTSSEAQRKLQKDESALERQNQRLDASYSHLLNVVTKYGKENGKMFSNRDFSDKYNSLVGSIKNNSVSLEQGRKQFHDLQTEVRSAGLESETMGSKMKNAFQNSFGSLISSTVFADVILGLKDIYNNVIEINDALTQLKIVNSTLSDGNFEDFANKAADSAQKIGASVTDIYSSTETYSRLGYSLDDSEKLATDTGIFSNIANVGTDEATTSLTSIMKAYGYSPDDMMNVISELTQVGQKYAISASELGVALEEGGSSLASANNSLEESLAILAAGNASVQDASKVGTAMKTVSARIRGAKSELEELGEETDKYTESTSTLRDELKGLTGVDIMKDDNTFKSTYEILLEIGKVYNSLSDTSQANVSEILGGKRQLNILSSIFQNLDDLSGAYEDASNAQGTAEKAQETYMESASAKTKQLQAVWQTFSNDVLSSEFIGRIIDLGDKALKTLDKITKTAGGLPTILTLVAGGLGAIKNVGRTKIINLSSQICRPIFKKIA